MCAFGDEDATAILNDVVEQVSVKKGVKRAVEDLVGEDTYVKVRGKFHVPEWVLIYFKTKGDHTLLNFLGISCSLCIKLAYKWHVPCAISKHFTLCFSCFADKD